MSGSHDNKRINRPISDSDKFPIDEPKSKWMKGGSDRAKRMNKFKKDFQSESSTNRPRSSSEGDTYEARYSRTGSLTESTVGSDPSLSLEDHEKAFDNTFGHHFDRIEKQNKLDEAIEKKRIRKIHRLKEALRLDDEGYTEDDGTGLSDEELEMLELGIGPSDGSDLDDEDDDDFSDDDLDDLSDDDEDF